MNADTKPVQVPKAYKAPKTPEVLKVGFFGGAFDPPHRGHELVARTALQQLKLDVLNIVPTGFAGHKARPLSPVSHRLAMAQRAFAGLPHTVVEPIEIDRYCGTHQPSYTFDSLLALNERYAKQGLALEWHLVVGQDQAQTLSQWHEAERLLGMVRVAWYPRQGATVNATDGSSNHAADQAIDPTYTALALPQQQLPVSSSAIRALCQSAQSDAPMLAENAALQSWCHPHVVAYFLDQRLYT